MKLRNVVLGLGSFAGGVAALAIGGVALATRRPSEGEGSTDNGPTPKPQPAPTGTEGHAAPDLAAGQDLGSDHRAPTAFRPDMDAPMTDAEREALRPATGPSPSLVSDKGGSVQGPGGDLR